MLGARPLGGCRESRVLLRGIRLPAPQAALLNASMGHALDFDDTLDTGGSIHPGVSVLAAALATADRLGVVSGRDFLLAVALGLDVSCRIAVASTLDRGWHRTVAIGVFGAAAAAGKLLGLTAEQMLNAFDIAYSHAAGNRQRILDGALTKRLQAGQAAGAGVFPRSWRRPGSPARIISSTAVSVFSSCTSQTGTIPRCCCAIWARCFTARR
jgi:2-methylcitrate dehydratase PrpD